MSFSVRFLYTLVISCFMCGICFAQGAPVDFDTRGGFQEQSSHFSDFAKQIPKSHTEVFAVNDVASHVEALLKNRALAKVLKEGAIAEFARQMGGNKVDPKDGLRWLDENREYFPMTVAITGSEDAYPFLVDAFEIILRLSIVGSAVESLEDIPQQQIDELGEELDKIVQDLGLPDTSIWIQWNENAVAKQIFTTMRSQISVAGTVTDLKFKPAESSMVLSGNVADVLDESITENYLLAMGFDQNVESLKAAVSGIKILLQVDLRDNGILISIGSDPTTKPPADASDLVGIENGANQIAYAQWNGKRWHEAARELQRSMDRWAKTDIGQLAIDFDTEDMWGSFRTAAKQMLQLAENGQLNVWRSKSQVFGRIRQVGVKSAETLVGDSVLKWVPADAESYVLSSKRSFAEYAAAWMDYFEERMATQSLKFDLRGNQEASSLIEAMTIGYYENFQRMRTVVRDEMTKFDALPFAVVMDTEGKMDSFTIKSDSELLMGGVEFNDDRFFRFAAVSRADQPEQLKQKIAEVYRQFVAGVIAAGKVDAAAELTIFKELELRDGISATEMSLDWIEELQFAELQIKGDFQPHVFSKDGFVVFSTSRRLSLRLIDANPNLNIDANKDGDSVVEFGRLRGKTVGNLYRTMFQSIGKLVATEVAVENTMSGLADGISEISAIMKHCDWKTTQNKNLQESLYVLDFEN